ncbi:hypothetical protein ILUMI_25475 [Ignelater luminosus]|uniref:Uncharacterized protein n=1 Tax=Ignelater luminosus TaxID=2038154 RepID=A0A8K0C8G0_IGNLU|nr:hypothetical protein ILUMI_25475 [Ignelater luminosus]
MQKTRLIDAVRKGGREGRQSTEEHLKERQEEEAQEEGQLRHLHLQGAETDPSGHRHLQQGHVDHEQLRERHLQAHRRRSVPPRPLQQAVDDNESRDPDRRAPSAARRVGQARRVKQTHLEFREPKNG